MKAPPIRAGIKSLRKEASGVGESRGPMSGGLQPSVSSVPEGITALASIGMCAYMCISIHTHKPTCDYKLIKIKSSKRKLRSEFGGTCLQSQPLGSWD